MLALGALCYCHSANTNVALSLPARPPAQALFDILLPPHRQQVSTIPMSLALQDLRLTSDNEIITAHRAAFCSFLCFLREEAIDDEGIYHQKAAPLGVKKPRKLGDYLLNHCHIKNTAPRAAF